MQGTWDYRPKHHIVPGCLRLTVRKVENCQVDLWLYSKAAASKPLISETGETHALRTCVFVHLGFFFESFLSWLLCFLFLFVDLFGLVDFTVYIWLCLKPTAWQKGWVMGYYGGARRVCWSFRSRYVFSWFHGSSVGAAISASGKAGGIFWVGGEEVEGCSSWVTFTVQAFTLFMAQNLIFLFYHFRLHV